MFFIILRMASTDQNIEFRISKQFNAKIFKAVENLNFNELCERNLFFAEL